MQFMVQCVGFATTLHLFLINCNIGSAIDIRVKEAGSVVAFPYTFYTSYTRNPCGEHVSVACLAYKDL